MDQPSPANEPSVAEREAQRAAEQEALRNVRRLTDELEQEQRQRRRLQRWGWVVVAVLFAGLAYVLYSIWSKAHRQPPPARIEVPAKVDVPKK